MKQLSKIMLAAVATIAFVMPAIAWDFGASGSAFSRWRHTTSNTGVSGAKDSVNNRFDSEGSKVTLTSSNSDGANTASFSYSAGWNPDPGNFDESVSLSGSKTVGEWTASSSTSASMTQDAGDADQSTNALAGKGLSQQSATSAAITLTNGSITYKLGDAAHLSSAEKAVNGPMGGTVDAEARVDSFNGFSVGMGVGPGTLTVAIDENSGTTVLGESTLTLACGSNTTGFGFNFSGDVGADLSFTYGTGSGSANVLTCTGDNKADASSSSTMGLGVAVPIGGMSLALDYESSATSATDNKTETTVGQSGFEISFTMPVSDATVGINISSQLKSTKVGTGTAADVESAGTELWYTTPIGPVSLSVGYGSGGVTSKSRIDPDTGVAVTKAETVTTSEFGAKMSMSF
jgi:hypothetical protein